MLGSLPMDCPTDFQKFGNVLLSNFREQFPAATKTCRTLTFRRFIRCFLRVCTMATWSSRADPSTQSRPTRALVCSYRKGFRSMSTASFCGGKERPMDSILKPACSCARGRHRRRATWVGATQDLSIAWHVDRHTTVRFLAAYYEVGSYLRETQPLGKNTAYLSVIANYKF